MWTRGTQSFQPPGTLGTDGTQSFQPPGTLGTGGTQSFQPPRHGLVGLSHFSPSGTLWTGGTQSFQPPGTLETGGTQSFQPPRHPVDWWDSVISAPQAPWGLTLTGESLRSQDLSWYSGEVCRSYKSWNFNSSIFSDISVSCCHDHEMGV